MSEVDRDVSAAVSTTITLLDKIEVCESQRGSPEGESAGQETEDERKEKQEQRILGDTKADEKKSPGEGSRNEGDALGERRSGSRSSSRRSSGVNRLPPYLERRRSNSHAPKQPPDEHTILRLTALDPSTDEFLVDAGIRIDESVIRSRLPGPQTPSRLARWRAGDRPYSSATQDSLDAKGRPTSRLRQPTIVATSRIPAPPGSLGHMPEGSESTLRKGESGLEQRRRSQGPGGSGGSSVVTRLRPPQRPGRPTSTVAPAAPHGPLTSRTKSLSHENLRTSPSRLALPSSPTLSPGSSRAASPNTSPQEEGRPRTLNVAGSRLRQPQVRTSRGRGSRPTSCSSSPGGSRCSSPGLDGPVGGFGRGSRNGSRASSTSSSPATSRCSSPAGEELRPMGRATQHRTNPSSARNGSSSSRPTRHGSNTSLQEQVTTPPSPGPASRQPHLQSSGIPKPLGVSRTKSATSKLPLPTPSKN